MSDLEDVTENYAQIHEAGEGWDSIIGRVESVGDHRLSAHLRSLSAGGKPEAVTEPPKQRSAGRKAISTQKKGSVKAAADGNDGAE